MTLETAIRHSDMYDSPEHMTAQSFAVLASCLSGASLVDEAIPQLKPGAVLVRIGATPPETPDLLMARSGYQIKRDSILKGRFDIAGFVVGIGQSPTSVRQGDVLIVLTKFDGFHEHGVFGEDAVCSKPLSLSFLQTVALGTAYLASFAPVIRCARKERGKILFERGAAIDVGLDAWDLGIVSPVRVVTFVRSKTKRRAPHSSVAHLEKYELHSEPVKTATAGRVRVISDIAGHDITSESRLFIALGRLPLVMDSVSRRAAIIRTNIAPIKGLSNVCARAVEYGRRLTAKGRDNLLLLFGLTKVRVARPDGFAEIPLEDWRTRLDMVAGLQGIGRVVLVHPTC